MAGICSESGRKQTMNGRDELRAAASYGGVTHISDAIYDFIVERFVPASERKKHTTAVKRATPPDDTSRIANQPPDFPDR